MASLLDDELRFLAHQHPRATWERHVNLGAIARFWLQRHAMFRDLERAIGDGIEGALDGQADGASFRLWLDRYLGFFVGQLEEHHAVEDKHYFPVFRRAEPRLTRGFEILERDHGALHRALEDLGQCAGLVLHGDLPADAASFRSRLGRLGEAQAALGPSLLRHLDDEEELVVPLILDQGERTLFGPL